MRRNKSSLVVGSVLTIATLLVTWVSPLLVAPKAYAAGVAVTVTPSEAATGDTTNKVVSFTTATEIPIGGTVIVSYADAYVDTTLTDAGVVMNVGAPTEVVSIANNTVTFTTTEVIAASTAVTITFTGSALVAPSTAGNYSYVVTTTAGTSGDFGAALQYIGDDNDVLVTAQVQPTLAFAIRNDGDTADTNVCQLGVLSMTAVKTCAYRLKVTTNADSGFTVTMASSGALTDGTNDINAITEGSTVAAGTEGYGVAFAGGAITGGNVTEQGDFTDDDTPVPVPSTNLYIADGNNNPIAIDTTNTALVTHRAAVDANTNTGNYSQTVTYTVTASF